MSTNHYIHPLSKSFFMFKISINTISFLLLAGMVHAQITFQQKEPILQKDSSRIMIGYSIIETKAKPGDYLAKYNLHLTYTQDGGATFIGPLKNVTGDVGKDLIAGKDQKIYWHYLAEGNNFNGKNVEFKIDASYEPFLGGTLNALRSALLPGWGNIYVKDRKKLKWRWVATTVATYGLIAGSLYLKRLSNDNYQKYLNATTFDDTQNFYRQANGQNFLAVVAAVAAVGLWAYDIVQVAIRGTKNKLNKRRIIKQNLKRKQKLLSFGFNPWLKAPLVGLSWKF